jgi:hypothetical protein
MYGDKEETKSNYYVEVLPQRTGFCKPKTDHYKNTKGSSSYVETLYARNT